MSIMIKGAEMPKGCAECPCILEEWMCGAKGLYVHNELINPFKERPNWCPLAEVVRCKDCKYGTWKISKLDNKTKVYECAIHAVFENDFGDNGYCSFGERKEQEHK